MRASQDELNIRLKEAEKKWRSNDVELQQAQEVVMLLVNTLAMLCQLILILFSHWQQLKELAVVLNKSGMICKKKFLHPDRNC